MKEAELPCAVSTPFEIQASPHVIETAPVCQRKSFTPTTSPQSVTDKTALFESVVRMLCKREQG